MVSWLDKSSMVLEEVVELIINVKWSFYINHEFLHVYNTCFAWLELVITYFIVLNNLFKDGIAHLKYGSTNSQEDNTKESKSNNVTLVCLLWSPWRKSLLLKIGSLELANLYLSSFSLVVFSLFNRVHIEY